MTLFTARHAAYTQPMQDHPQASRYVTFQGREILRGRGFLRSNRVLCPAGHKVDQPVRLLEDALIYCDHRNGPKQPACGWTIYVLQFPARGGKKRTYAADCTREELATIERLELDPDGILHYFGETFSR